MIIIQIYKRKIDKFKHLSSYETYKKSVNV